MNIPFSEIWVTSQNIFYGKLRKILLQIDHFLEELSTPQWGVTTLFAFDDDNHSDDDDDYDYYADCDDIDDAD